MHLATNFRFAWSITDSTGGCKRVLHLQSDFYLQSLYWGRYNFTSMKFLPPWKIIYHFLPRSRQGAVCYKEHDSFKKFLIRWSYNFFSPHSIPTPLRNALKVNVEKCGKSQFLLLGSPIQGAVIGRSVLFLLLWNGSVYNFSSSNAAGSLLNTEL